MQIARLASTNWLVVVGLLFFACTVPVPAPPPSEQTPGTFTVGGTVTGLGSGKSVVLQNNAADDLTVSTNGAFTFATPLREGSTWAITVKTHPNGQTCQVTGGSGTLSGAAITSAAVTCTTNTFSVGGTVSGLGQGRTVVLQNNAGDDLTVSANGAFTFATAVADGSTWAVTVLTQPTGETCQVANGAGTVSGAAVTSAVVTCTKNNYTVGGTVSGLGSGKSVVLQNNLADDLTVSASGAFTFATPLVDGSAYSVTVKTQPAGHTCTANQGTGVVNAANVNTVSVVCLQSGSPDNSFGTGGSTWSSTGGLSSIAMAVILQPDGKVVAGGSIGLGNDWHFALARYNPSGSLDTTFDSDGWATASFSDGGYETAYALALQPDGKIIAAGGADTSYALARFDPDGSLDTTFGTNGKVSGAISAGYDSFAGVALASDGKIVGAGVAYDGGGNYAALVARYNSDGSPDTRFGTGGIVVYDNSTTGSYEAAEEVTVLSDLSIVTAGQVVKSGKRYIALAKFSSDGIPDNAFSSFVGAAGGDSAAYGLAVQPDGKIVVGGYTTNVAGTDEGIVALRVLANGTLDSTFGTGGIAYSLLGPSFDRAYGLALQTDGKIVLAGKATEGGEEKFLIARYTSAGVLDADFGTNGVTTLALNTGDDGAEGVVIQPDGKIVAVGYTSVGSLANVAVARVNP